MSPADARRAYLLVDHGSRREEANVQLERTAEAMRKRVDAPVLVAHLEIAPPDVSAGIDACVAAGATEIVVLLYFLTPGRHSRDDIPAQARAAAARHPGVEVRLAGPLGPDEKLVDLLIERARDATPVG